MSTNDHLGGCYKCGDANTIMPDIWGWLMVEYNIQSVLDVGCGYGHALSWFENFPIHCVGVDGYIDAINDKVCRTNIIQHDYTLGNLDYNHNFDLCWCAEFLEHVEEKYLNFIFDSFLKCKYVCITHAHPDQIGYHHVNCQNDEYWIEKFKEHNFSFDKKISDKLRLSNRWNAGWGRNSLMFFYKNI